MIVRGLRDRLNLRIVVSTMATREKSIDEANTGQNFLPFRGRLDRGFDGNAPDALGARR